MPTDCDPGYRSVMAGPGAEPVERPTGGKQLAREGAAQAHDPLTLDTMCACGHTRKYHRGLRMEAIGPCLECGCEKFRRVASPSHDQLVQRVRAALDRVEHMHEIVASLRAELSHEAHNGDANGR
jgi:hypothetical protein